MSLRRARLGGWLPESIAVLAAIVAAGYVARGAWGQGFPVDDAWIHLVYGLELFRHGTLAYNDGVPATGATSPLWVLFAALAHAVVGARGPSMAAATALKVFSALTHATASGLAARCGRLAAARARIAPVVSLVTGVMVAACPLLAYAAVSGMEVGLTSALLLAAVLAASRGRAALTGLAIGLAILARPECCVVAPVVLTLVASRAPSLRGAVARIAVGAAIAGALTAALLVRNQLVSGRPLPATFYVKAAPVHGQVMLEIRMERGFKGVLGVLAPTSSRLFWALALLAILAGVASAIGALVRRVRRGRPLRAALTGACAALGGVAYAAAVSWIVRVMRADAFYFQRYFAPSIPLLIVGATSGASLLVTLAAAALRSLRARPRLRMLRGSAAALGACALVAEVPGLSDQPARYRREVADIDAVQVALGRFIAATVPPDGVVWSMDAGALRYWGERFVVDLGKLNTPDLFVDGEARPGYEADLIVTIEGDPVRVVAADGTLDEVYRARAPSWPPPPEAPEYTQAARRCRPGVPADRERIAVEGYPDPRRGRCKAR